MGRLIDLAKRESPTPLGKSAAIADERNLTAAKAASRLEESGSNGSTPPEGCREIEALDPAALWWRVSITEPGGRAFEVDTPSGWTLPEWQAYATRYHGPVAVVTPIAGLPEPRAPVPLDEALTTACKGVAGITPAELRSLLDAEDLRDILSGAIGVESLAAYAASFAEGIASGRIVVPGGEPEVKG